MARILTTNGGPHPPEKWAMTTAEQVFDISSSVAGDRLIQAQKMQLAIAEAVMPHHEKVQKDQVSSLLADVANILSPFAIEQYLDQVIKDIVAIAQGTIWQSHFAKPEVQAAAREVIASNFQAAQHIERMWHADRNPDCKVSQSYKAKFGV